MIMLKAHPLVSCPAVKLLSILAALACLSLTACRTVRAEVPIAKDAQPVGVIVSNGNDQTPPKFAHVRGGPKHLLSPSAYLQKYLQEITGAELPVVGTAAEAGDQSAIVLRIVDKVPGASDRPTGRQAYKIETQGNQVILTAANTMGLYSAVFGFLEDHLGCRFYTPRISGLDYVGRGTEVIPFKPTLTLEAIKDFQEPALANRGVVFWLGSYPWLLKNRAVGYPADTGSAGFYSQHNLYHHLPPRDVKQYGQDIPGLFERYPEFYPMNKDGVREPDWTYGISMDDRMPPYIAESLIREIEHRKETQGELYDPNDVISLGQGDGFTGCLSEAVRKLVEEEGSEMAPLLTMFNRALEIVEKKYPDQQFITFAYFDTLDVPKTIKPHKNLWINVVSSARSANMAGDQMGPIKDNPANRDYATAIQEWSRVAPGRVMVWHWDTYQADWPSMYFVDDNVRFMRDAGVYGINPQFCGGPWADMLAWLYVKLGWNPELNGDELIQQFAEDNYGKEAAEHVVAYLKRARDSYLDAGYVPSAVRWSGWTQTMLPKMFPARIRSELTGHMDKALAAAEKSSTPEQLQNLRAAIGASLDVLNLTAARYTGGAWGVVKAPADGALWYVPAADPVIVGAITRGVQGIQAAGGGEQGVPRSVSQFTAGVGGPAVRLESPAFEAAVVPGMRGQIVSAIERMSGKELLAPEGAEGGYQDDFTGISAQIWLPTTFEQDISAERDWSAIWSDFENPRRDSLITDVVISQPHFGFVQGNFMQRTVQVDDQGLHIEREWSQRGGMPANFPFTTRWRLALPEPRKGMVAISGGGIDQMLDLQYAVPGGIKGVRVGESLPGADWMDERFEDVIAVSDAEVTRLPVTRKEGMITIQLDRGDGVAAVLTTPAGGLDAVEIQPIVNQNHVVVRLVGIPGRAVPNQSPIMLPRQSLTARAVPLREVPSAVAEEAADVSVPVAANIRITGPDTAVNEIDGAELIWIPAGSFLRGSKEGVGAGDERPQRSIEMDGYWIYKTPVTLGQYKKFLEATGRTFSPPWGQGMLSGDDENPDVYPALTNWFVARDYALWAGANLPTEAQWEKAARGEDGREFPWGNEWDPEKAASYELTVGRHRQGMHPADSFPEGASPYGVLNMAGNVWEWVNDWYDYDAYRSEETRNPTGPETGSHKVLRGGVSLYDERLSRSASRMVHPPQVSDWTLTGFRCVVNAPGPTE